MGIMDSLEKEDRVQVKISDLYRFMETAARAEIITEIAKKIDGYYVRDVIKALADTEKDT